MRAVRSKGTGIELADVPRPEGEGVRVQVTHAGICGSDLSMLASRSFPDGLILGHELAGRTPDGTPVAIEPEVPCGHCAPCEAGRYNLCVKGDDSCLGLLNVDGGMAEEVLVPERCLVRLPDELPLADACLVEPTTVGLHGLHRAGAKAGERVVVIGAGSIGLLAAATARALGCKAEVVVRYPHQERMAKALGITPVNDSLGEGEFDLVAVAAGHRSAVELAPKLARPGGRLVYLALVEGSLLDGNDALAELSAITSMGYAYEDGKREIDQAAQLLADAPELSELITHRLPLDRAPEAFEVATNRRGGAIKVVLEP
jgi:threonine dehydrogenase-like Zn-dependent dehydrogenase